MLATISHGRSRSTRTSRSSVHAWPREPSARSTELLLGALEDLPGGVRSGTAGDPAARMGARARKVEPLEQEPVARLPQQGPPREELVERRLRVLDVPAGQAVARLHVDGRDHLARFDELAAAGRVSLERLDRDVADAVALGGPIAVAQRAGRRLEHDAHHVLALGRE